MSEDGKIACEICGARVHVMKAHLQEAHPEVSVQDYLTRFPNAEVLSQVAKDRIARAEASRVATPSAPAVTTTPATVDGFQEVSAYFHEVFNLGSVPAAMNKAGKPIPVKTYIAPSELRMFVPDRDPNYVFNIDLLRTVMTGLTFNIPTYLWGDAGTGKSTVLEQVFAHLGRPSIRVQHTRNTEEHHIIGQKTVTNGTVHFELGPLPFAMKHGLDYVMDEYDFAPPGVLALYQPVLEGKPLVIKEAEPENRIVRPHSNFRMYATGNTNGTGDETGLYQGTLVQNAANYERFGIVQRVDYMDPKIEAAIVAGQGGVTKAVAEKIVDFGKRCRDAYRDQKIGLPPSPRALIHAAKVGRLRGDFEIGLKQAYINRLGSSDRLAAEEFLRRISFT